MSARLLVALALVASDARAAGRRSVQIDLVVEPTDRPSALCILSTQKTDWTQPLADMVERVAGEADQWRFSAPPSQVAAALAPEGGACALATCAPQLTITTPRPLHLLCTQNLQPAPQLQPRVAVVFLDAGAGSAPGPIELRLTGTIATVYFAGALPGDASVTAHIAGGHYTASSASAPASRDRLILALEPLCRRHTVHVQSFQRNETADPRQPDRLQATFSDKTCDVRPDSGMRFALDLPVDHARTPKTMIVTWRQPGEPGHARLEHVWTTPSPEPLVELHYRTLSFSWRRSCNYPELTPRCPGAAEPWPLCPRATLIDLGLDCPGIADDDRCAYSCDIGNRAGEIRLPAALRFTGRLGERWSDAVVYANQELDSYVAAGERVLGVALCQRATWRSVPGDELSDIEVWAPDGSAHRVSVPPGGTTQVGLPGLACNEPLRTRVHGDKVYDERPQPVRHGWLLLDAPRPRRLRVGLFVGPGFTVRTEPDLAGEWYGAAGATLFVDLSRRWNLELDGEVQIAQRRYSGLTVSGERATPRRVASSRFGLSVGATRGAAWGRVGISAGVMAAFPFFTRDIGRMPNGDLMLSVAALWRWAWTDIALEVRAGCMAFADEVTFDRDQLLGTPGETVDRWPPQCGLRGRLRFGR